eukprot:Pgem_evm1s11962
MIGDDFEDSVYISEDASSSDNEGIEADIEIESLFEKFSDICKKPEFLENNELTHDLKLLIKIFLYTRFYNEEIKAHKDFVDDFCVKIGSFFLNVIGEPRSGKGYMCILESIILLFYTDRLKCVYFIPGNKCFRGLHKEVEQMYNSILFSFILFLKSGTHVNSEGFYDRTADFIEIKFIDTFDMLKSYSARKDDAKKYVFILNPYIIEVKGECLLDFLPKFGLIIDEMDALKDTIYFKRFLDGMCSMLDSNNTGLCKYMRLISPSGKSLAQLIGAFNYTDNRLFNIEPIFSKTFTSLLDVNLKVIKKECQKSCTNDDCDGYECDQKAQNKLINDFENQELAYVPIVCDSKEEVGNLCEDSGIRGCLELIAQVDNDTKNPQGGLFVFDKFAYEEKGEWKVEANIQRFLKIVTELNFLSYCVIYVDDQCSISVLLPIPKDTDAETIAKCEKCEKQLKRLGSGKFTGFFNHYGFKQWTFNNEGKIVVSEILSVIVNATLFTKIFCVSYVSFFVGMSMNCPNFHCNTMFLHLSSGVFEAFELENSVETIINVASRACGSGKSNLFTDLGTHILIAVSRYVNYYNQVESEDRHVQDLPVMVALAGIPKDKSNIYFNNYPFVKGFSDVQFITHTLFYGCTLVPKCIPSLYKGCEKVLVIDKRTIELLMTKFHYRLKSNINNTALPVLHQLEHNPVASNFFITKSDVGEYVDIDFIERQFTDFCYFTKLLRFQSSPNYPERLQRTITDHLNIFNTKMTKAKDMKDLIIGNRGFIFLIYLCLEKEPVCFEIVGSKKQTNSTIQFCTSFSMQSPFIPYFLHHKRSNRNSVSFYLFYNHLTVLKIKETLLFQLLKDAVREKYETEWPDINSADYFSKTLEIYNRNYSKLK